MKRRITEKRLNNKRFKKSEEALIRAFFSERRRLNARVIMKRAKISRSTLYRHHRTIYDIMPDYEDFILVKYNRLMRKLTEKKRINMRIIYYQMLIFILANKWIFEMMLKGENGHILEKMVRRLRLKTITANKLPEGVNKVITIYEKEIVGILEMWIRGGILECELERTLQDIMYLTDTMKQRLMPLIS